MGSIIQDQFIHCILNYDFDLSNIRKRAIEIAIKNDINRIQKEFSMEKVTIEKISEKDKKWRAGESSLIKKVLNHKLSRKLKKLAIELPFINEAFIFNDKGGLIATIKKTSDFDQSDEEKYDITKNFSHFSIRNISNIHFDESSNIYQVGILIRLENSKGEFAGGLYLGSNINKLITFYKLN